MNPSLTKNIDRNPLVVIENTGQFCSSATTPDNMAKRGRKDEPDPARSVREEFFPTGCKRGVVIRSQVDYSTSSRLLKYSLALIDARSTSVANVRILGYDNAHELCHRHSRGKMEPVDLVSYEDTQKRFEAEVRQYLEGKDGK